MLISWQVRIGPGWAEGFRAAQEAAPPFGIRMASDSSGKVSSQEQRFQTLVNAVVDYAIYMIDADGKIVTWNPGAKRF
jgi:PAS domain-containing protein